MVLLDHTVLQATDGWQQLHRIAYDNPITSMWECIGILELTILYDSYIVFLTTAPVDSMWECIGILQYWNFGDLSDKS